MPDWAIKFFDSISSVKSAARALATVLLVLFVWQPASTVFSSIGFPDDFIILFLTAGAFSVSYLVIRALEIGCLKIIDMLNDRKARIKKESDLASFQQRVRRSLPHLKPPELRVLRELVESEQRMDIRREGVSWLSKSGWISKIHQASAGEFVFQLSPVVSQLFIEFEENQFKKMVNQTISKLTEPQRDFLKIFWQEPIANGTRESQNLMPHEIYQAGSGLVTLLGLSKSEWREDGHMCERFVLNDYAKSRLESEVFGMPPVRIEANLNLEYVEGSRATGGGARGRI